MANRLLNIDGLSLNFPGYLGNVHAVNGVSMHIDEGEIVGVVGESGSAKSVTAMTALQLLPKNSFKVTAGRIELLGQDVLSLSEPQMTRLRSDNVAMIFQEPQTALNPTKKIGKQILQVLKIHTNMREREVYNFALSILRDMRINDAEEIMQRYPFELSGGMRQRILIGMAFACSPRLLIADEPTTALDVTVQRQVLQLMNAKARDTGTSIMFISHDLAVVSQFCDRVYVMYAGSVVESGPTARVLSHPSHPYTQALIEALPENAAPGQKLKSIAGSVPNLINLPEGCSFRERCTAAFERCSMKPPMFNSETSQGQVACWLSEGQKQ